ncbi:AsmA family protein [Roseococcus sp. YIM B11640]|uniref:AsmA family protein n=1 Tax=Roseococcus sp. YIM B11640 TaxID=3133973 RepID=UPI003C7B07A1
MSRGFVARGGLLALLLGLLAFAAAAAYALPRWLDWDKHREALAAIASQRLGRPVSLEGPVNLLLLPQARLEASRVVIGPTSDGIRMSARGLRLRLDLGALLLGRLEVRELALVGAEIKLPWPPGSLPGLTPLPWLTGLDARLEDSRIEIGGAVVEGVNAHLTAGAYSEALTAEGAMNWRGRPVRFQATLGRAGDDGVAPLDVTAMQGGLNLQARGVLLSEGGFEGRLEIAGPDLAALLPAPPGAFRATAQLAAGAEQLNATRLALEVGGQTVRGSAQLRLGVDPRFDLSLTAPRVEVEPWLLALRGAGPQAFPVSIDLTAEGAVLGAMQLRKLRASVFLQADRLTLGDVSAELPGETNVELSGASAGPRLDIGLRWRSARPELLAELLGVPFRTVLPRGASEGQLRLSWEGPQFAVTELTARLGGTRVTGGFVWRQQARPSLALGLDVDSLDLDMTPGGLLAALREARAASDLQLRVGISRLDLGGSVWERIALDGAAEANRVVLRRLAARHLGLDLAASGTVADNRIADLTLEAEGVAGPLLSRLGLERPALAATPVRLRASGGGPLDALALRVEGDFAEARLEAQATIDQPQERFQSTLTLRHPGAARMFGTLGQRQAPAWIGEGSFSLIAPITGRRGSWTAESLELVAGGLRGRGQLALNTAAERPALSGRFAFERLLLPSWRGAELTRWPPLDFDLALSAESLQPEGLPTLEQASAHLRGDGQAVKLEDFRAALGGGTVEGSLAWQRTDQPRLALAGRFADIVLTGPLTDRPVDIGSGRLSGELDLRSGGHAPESVIAGLTGTAQVTLRDGVVLGLDSAAAAAALGQSNPRDVESTLRTALSGGATPVERGSARLTIENGRVNFTEATLSGEGGLLLGLAGQIDLPRDVLDLNLTLPVAEGAPETGLRLTGSSRTPRRLVQIAPWLRWRAEHPALP